MTLLLLNLVGPHTNRLHSIVILNYPFVFEDAPFSALTLIPAGRELSYPLRRQGATVLRWNSSLSSLAPTTRGIIKKDATIKNGTLKKNASTRNGHSILAGHRYPGTHRGGPRPGQPNKRWEIIIGSWWGGSRQWSQHPSACYEHACYAACYDSTLHVDHALETMTVDSYFPFLPLRKTQKPSEILMLAKLFSSKFHKPMWGFMAFPALNIILLRKKMTLEQYFCQYWDILNSDILENEAMWGCLFLLCDLIFHGLTTAKHPSLGRAPWKQGLENIMKGLKAMMPGILSIQTQANNKTLACIWSIHSIQY